MILAPLFAGGLFFVAAILALTILTLVIFSLAPPHRSGGLNRKET